MAPVEAGARGGGAKPEWQTPALELTIHDTTIHDTKQMTTQRSGIVLDTRTLAFGLIGALALGLTACGPSRSEFPEQIGGTDQHDPLGSEADAGRGYVFGGDAEDGYLIVGGESESETKPLDKKAEKRLRKEQERREEAAAAAAMPASAPVSLGVNEFLWRATLDTLSFMPLASADPFGGVVLTDWYSAPETPNERFKVQVFILDKNLRADAIRLNVFRQERSASTGLWGDAPVTQDTKIKLENAILTSARQLRITTLGDE